MKLSIRYKLPAIFAILMLAAFGICILANSLLFDKFYLSKKRQMLEKNFYNMQTTLNRTDNEADILSEFEQVMNNSGISVILLDASGKVKYASTSNVNPLRNLFFEAVLRQGEDGVIHNKDYFISSIKDEANGTEYMVLVGAASDSNFLMLRVTVESIRESVAIANTFTGSIIALAAIVGVIIVFVVSKSITKPILELAAISAKMTELDFDTKYQPGYGGEIDVLGHNMNKMSHALEENISQLKSANLSLENELKEKTEIDEMRKEFLGNVSHELKTPIALIQGYAEGLKEGIADDPESRKEYCDIIIDESGRMNHMVRQLLDLNRLEMGREELSMERFDVVELIDSRVAAFDVKMKQAGVSITTKGERSAMVWSDAYKVEEVLNNYLSNAFDHVDYDNIITVTTEKMEDKTRISVFNTGNNIPDEELDKLWIKLYKSDKARTREFGGCGLGLSIVKAIMEALNNNYGVKNCDNGVIFWFEIDNG
ncbi:MAG: HAMP domain-containing protein [Lachnospiraceae bacterium]|nr:HAMP domain-containing protein [Lachnospiraceae bacterium]